MNHVFPIKANLLAAASELHETWSPKVVALANDQFLKVVKIQGELIWHAHTDEDELFMVLQGSLVIQYKDRENVELKAGDVHVVPRGVLHCPLAAKECLMALIEPVSTRHTGELVTERTRTIEEQLGIS